MVSSKERRRLEDLHRPPLDARAALAKCAAGLLIIVGIAAIGVVAPAPESAVIATNEQPAANDR
jgi:hypothetical protein